nr:hypothetical protein [Prevotella sp.]
INSITKNCSHWFLPTASQMAHAFVELAKNAWMASSSNGEFYDFIPTGKVGSTLTQDWYLKVLKQLFRRVGANGMDKAPNGSYWLFTHKPYKTEPKKAWYYEINSAGAILMDGEKSQQRQVRGFMAISTKATN